MAHPSRLDRARALAVAHPELKARIAVDPAPEAGPSSLRTARLAWSLAAADATHHLVLQEDAVLVPGFAERLAALLDAAPRAGVALFTEWGSYSAYAVRLCALTGRSPAPVVDQYTPSVALALPAAVARDFGCDADANTAKDDVALHRFLAAAKVPVRVAVPNLADHTGDTSLVGNDAMGPRRSVWLGPAAGRSEGPQFERIPLLRWQSGVPACAYRRGHGWQLTPLRRFLGEAGIEPTALADRARRAVDPLARGRVPALRFLLAALWLTAYGLGVEARRIGAVAGWPAEPITTMVDGTLRGHVSAPELAAVRTGAQEMALDAVGQGLRP